MMGIQMRKLASLLLLFPCVALATQDLSFSFTGQSLGDITYVAECKQTGPGSADSRVIRGSVANQESITLTGLADGPQFCWMKACWTTDTACQTTVGTGTVVGPAGTGAQAVATAGANGTVSPSRQSVVKGSTAGFTVTPSGGYTASMGGTCPAGSLVGTTYTTGTLTQADCTVQAAFAIGGGGADIVSPTISTAAINSAGTTLTVGFSEAVVLNDAIPTLSSSIGAPVLSSPSSGTASSHTWTIAPPVLPQAVVYLDYAQPGDGIEDAAGNDLAPRQGVSVTNGSTITDLSSMEVSPADKQAFKRSTTSVALSVVTDAAAECGYSTSPMTPWDSLTELATADDLTHTASVAVVSGQVTTTCFRCRSTVTGLTLPDHCPRWGVEPLPKGVFR